MSQPRLEIRVGLFVLIGLVLLGALMLLFSKGTTFLTGTYELRLKSANVGGIRAGANVLLAGVPVGRVAEVQLGPQGTNVTILLRIFAKHPLYAGAAFKIQQFGFLGDQYVSITPGTNYARLLKTGDEVDCENPFDMQETVATAVETIKRIGQVTTNVNAAVTDVRRLVLTEQKLSSVGASLDRFALLTVDALNAVSNVNALLSANSFPVTLAVSNLSHFSTQLAPLATNINEWMATNEDRITLILQNFESGSVLLSNLLHGLNAGQGAAGRLLRDEELAANLASVARNLAVTTSNLNQRGLWSILWKQKEQRTNPPPGRVLTAPHDPFR